MFAGKVFWFLALVTEPRLGGLSTVLGCLTQFLELPYLAIELPLKVATKGAFCD